MVEQQEPTVTRRTVGRGTQMISVSGATRDAVELAAYRAWSASDRWLRSPTPPLAIGSTRTGYTAAFYVADAE